MIMKKVILIIMITLLFINLILFTNYGFASENSSNNNSNSRSQIKKANKTFSAKIVSNVTINLNNNNINSKQNKR